MVEAGGISKGRWATAWEDMDGAMADCGGETGGGLAAEAVAAAFWECIYIHFLILGHIHFCGHIHFLISERSE